MKAVCTYKTCSIRVESEVILVQYRINTVSKVRQWQSSLH
jgi:hypothetical protein